MAKKSTPLPGIAEPLSLGDWLDLRNHDDVAVIGFFDRKSSQWHTQTHQQFINRARQLGDRLRADGIAENGRLAIACSSQESTLLAFLASLLSGITPAIVPVRNAFDTAADAKTRLGLTHSLLGKQSALLSDKPDKSELFGFDRAITFEPLDLDGDASAPSLPKPTTDISHIQLTSGSTGPSKGIILSRHNVVTNIRALSERTQAKPGESNVSWLPLYHDMGLVSQALTPMLLGLDTFLMSPFDFLSDPMRWIVALSEKRAAFTASPTFGYDLVVDRASKTSLDGLDLSNLRAAFCGAEPIRAQVADAFSTTFAEHGLRPTAFTPSYGLAEATVAVTSKPAESAWLCLQTTRASLTKLSKVSLSTGDTADVTPVVSAGTPLPGVTLRVVDEHDTVVTEDLHCGEIVVSGDSIAVGEIAENGDTISFDTAALHTGDIGFMYEGELFIVDRIKDIIIRKGENFSASTIEASIASRLGTSADQVVVVDRDIAHGADLTAVIEIKEPAQASARLAQLVEHLDEFYPPLDHVIFTKRGALPRTTSGKKRHRSVRDLINNGELKVISATQVRIQAPEKAAGLLMSNSQIVEGDVPNDDLRERLLLKLVAESLRARGLDTPITLDSRFQLDMDFDSLTLLDLVTHVESEFKIELPREALTKVKTIRDLAAQIANAKHSEKQASLESLVARLRAQIPQNHCVVEDVKPGRKIKVKGRWLDDFSSCNYLGLEERDEMIEAVANMHRKWGLQRWPTRSVVVVKPAIDLEHRIADLLGVPDTLLFPTITLLHTGVLSVLTEGGGAIIVDSEAHKSMQEAATLAQAKGAQVTITRHNDFEHLETRLKSTQHLPSRLIVIDGVYSMSGEIVDFPRYQELARKYDATIYLDDAHGFGVIGERPTSTMPYGFRGNGTVQHFGGDYDRTIYVGGTAKAHSTTLAFITCPTPEYRGLFERASTMIFGHSAPFAALAAADMALTINEREGDEIRSRLYELSSTLVEGARNLGFRVPESPTPIVKVTVGDLDSTIIANQTLWEDKIMLTPAVFPAAPLDQGGLRLTVTASNTHKQISHVISTLEKVKQRLADRGQTSTTDASVATSTASAAPAGEPATQPARKTTKSGTKKKRPSTGKVNSSLQ